MNRNTQLWGWGLLALGVLFLLQNLGLNFVGWIWGLVFIALGAGFLWYQQQNPSSHWWALIPGFTLLGLGTLIVFEPLFGDNWGGAVFLGAIGLGFLAVYWVQRSYWWAVIPGGTLLTLAVVAGTDGSNGDGGWLFFLGLTATFAAVYFLGQRWAVFPAAACLVLALLTNDGMQSLLGTLIPLALVLGGAYLLLQNRQRPPLPPQPSGSGGSVPPTTFGDQYKARDDEAGSGKPEAGS